MCVCIFFVHNLRIMYYNLSVSSLFFSLSFSERKHHALMRTHISHQVIDNLLRRDSISSNGARSLHSFAVTVTLFLPSRSAENSLRMMRLFVPRSPSHAVANYVARNHQARLTPRVPGG